MIHNDVYNTKNYPLLLAHHGNWDIYANEKGDCAAIPVVEGCFATHFGDLHYLKSVPNLQYVYHPPAVSTEWHERIRMTIPEHMVGGLIRYLEDGMIPGHFLSAILMNDLYGAVRAADDINIRRLPDFVNALYNYAPAGSWGSPEKVKLWSISRKYRAQRRDE